MERRGERGEDVDQAIDWVDGIRASSAAHDARDEKRTKEERSVRLESGAMNNGG